ncbi:MAG TPA: hypothetical protein VFL79_03590 [Terriglobia bacterium]|nr:hypothetical protein [Terriglobia bacterium]
MSKTYSVINDLYGVGSASQKPERQGVWGLVVVILLGGLVLYQSIHPVIRLRSEPPSVVLKNRASRSATATHGQEYAANSYWGTATSYVTEKYPYGEALPSTPSEGFTLAMGGDYATSNVYWQRLRELWNEPDMWVKSFHVDTGWINNALGSVGKIVQDYISS